MANFLDATADIEQRLEEYSLRLSRIDSHLRRGEQRAARAQLTGFLEELVDFAHEIELPVETVVVGAQLGFFSGGSFLLGRMPGALFGAAAGWLYGQQVMQRYRLALEGLAEKVAVMMYALESERFAADEVKTSTTEELDRKGEFTSAERVTQEVDRD